MFYLWWLTQKYLSIWSIYNGTDFLWFFLMHLFTSDMDYNDHCCYSLDGVFNAYISYIIWFFFF